MSFQIRRTLLGTALIIILFLTAADARQPIRLFFEKTLPNAPVKTKEHTVQQGEWLYKILKVHGFSKTDISYLLPLLKQLNPDITDFNRLVPGQRLILPGSGPVLIPIKAAQQPATLQKPQPQPPASAAKKYTVRPGDTLLNILQRASGLSTPRIYSRLLPRFRNMNPGLSDINRLYPGQTIHIPSRDEEAVGPYPKEGTPPAEKEKTQTSTPDSHPKLSPAQQKRFSLAILKRAGFRFTPGKHVLYPDPGGGWVSIDLLSTPVCKTPWNTTAIFEQVDKQHLKQHPPSTPARVRFENWAPETVIRSLADTFPQNVSRPASGSITRQRGAAEISVSGPNMFTLKALDRSTTFCFAPVRPKDTGLSSLLKSYLAQGEIIITEAAVTSPGDITLSPSAPLSRDSLYLPEIHAARAASELAAFLGPSALSSSLQSLARKKTYELHALTESGLLKQRPLNLTWSSGGVTVSITLPALILEQNGSKIALLDQSIADHYLMSLVALKGYLCFELITF